VRALLGLLAWTASLPTHAAPAPDDDLVGVWAGRRTGVLQVQRTPGGGYTYTFENDTLTCGGAAATLSRAPLSCEGTVEATVDVRASTALVSAMGVRHRLRRVDPFTAFVDRHLEELRRSDLRSVDGRSLLETLGPNPASTMRRLAGRLRALYAATGFRPRALILDDVDELFRIAHMSLLATCGDTRSPTPTCRVDDQHRVLAASVSEFLAGRAEDDKR
jgi:hypothetical protein